MMQDSRSELKNKFLEACQGLRTEKELSVSNTILIGYLYGSNGPINLQMSETEYLKQLGLTKDSYYSRAMAARVITRFPDYEAAFRAGEIGISVLAAVAPKITDVNSETILRNVRGKTKREARCFLSKVDCDGNINDKEGSVEITLTLKESDLKKLEEARSVLSHSGKLPTNVEIILQALEDLLDKRDPIRKAERAKARAEKKGQAQAVPVREDEAEPTNTPLASPDRDESKSRSHIPRQNEHAVWFREQRRCTHRYDDGTRCEATTMLEIDHVKPWCRSGDHSVENLHISCSSLEGHPRGLVSKGLSGSKPLCLK